MIDLKKTIERGTWRFVGQRLLSVDVSKIPVAGASLDDIQKSLNSPCFRIGRVSVENAFVVEYGPLRLLYVRPDYSSYRMTAKRVFQPCAWEVDFDHALGKRIAHELKYRYVLMLRVVPGVNRAHGRYEQSVVNGVAIPPLCFADDRIRNKWVGRRPTHMRDYLPLEYDPGKVCRYGLTLQQLGRLGFAMGLEDNPVFPPCLKLLQLPIRTRLSASTTRNSVNVTSAT